MSTFDRAFQAWRAAPFPSGSPDDVLDEMRAELAQWDAFVADEVISYRSDRRLPESVVDLTAALQDFLARATLMQSERSDRDLMGEYVSYATLLWNVHIAASQAATHGAEEETA